MSTVINIHLIKINSPDFNYTGFKVLAQFLRKNSNEIKVDSIEASTDATGKCSMPVSSFPTVDTIVGKISFISISPQGQIVAQLDHELTDLLQLVSISIEFDTSLILPELPKNPVPIEQQFIHGRVLEKTGRKQMEEMQLIIFASKPNEAENFAPILSATTEAKGYFILPFPSESFSDAFAIVGGKLKENKIPIKLEIDLQQQKHFPKNLILVVELEESTSTNSTEECGCQEFNFHEPKRIIEEYSFYSVVRTSEPEIKTFSIEEDEEMTLEDFIKASPTIKNELVQVVVKNPNSILAKYITKKPSISIEARATPLLPNEAEILSKLKEIRIDKTVARSFLNRYKNLTTENVDELVRMNDELKLKKALDSKRLRPVGRLELDSTNEIDWDETPTIFQATSISFGHLLHFKQQWLADGYSLGDLLYSLPLAPGQKKQIVVFDWERKESASNIQSIDYEERLYNSLARDRDTYEIAKGILNEKVSGSSHASTGGFGLGLGLAGIVDGVAGVLGISGGFSSSSSGASQNSLRNATVSNLQQLSDRTIQSANVVRSQRATVIQTVAQGERFEVSSESVANYNHCHAMTMQYFEVLRHFKINQRLVDVQECLFIPLPITKFTVEKALRFKETLRKFLIDSSLSKGFDAMQRAQAGWENSDLPETTFAAERIEALSGELRIFFEIKRPKDTVRKTDFDIIIDGGTFALKGELVEEFDPAAWTELEAFLPSLTAKEFYDKNLKYRRNKDEIFYRELGAEISRNIIKLMTFNVVTENNIDLGVINIDASLASKYYINLPSIVSFRLNPPVSLTRQQFNYLSINLTASLPSGIAVRVEAGSANYRTKHFSGPLFKYSRIGNDLSKDDGVLIFCAPTGDELKNPKKEEVSMINLLLHHLNDNLEFYHTMIWLNMSPERRFMLLDGINLKVRLRPGQFVSKSVASLVENRIIGIAGNSLIMPVVAGLNINPDFEFNMINTNGTEVVALADFYNIAPIDPISVAVPTKGVFAEAIMGSCNSCEIKDERRFWRWDEAPIPDSPTTINPISTDSRRSDPGNLQPLPLANPVVNIQNAPNVPDPSGIANLMQLLGKSDAFRDITGLSENQKNALATFQASLSTAKEFGEQAANMMKLVQDAKKEGAISNEDASDKINKLIESTLPKSSNEEREESSKDVELIDEAKQKDQIDDSQAKEMTEDRIRKGQGTTKAPPARRARRTGRKKYNLTLNMLDFRGRLLEGTFLVSFGSLLDTVFQNKNTGVQHFTVELDPSIDNFIQIKGNPILEDIDSSSDSSTFYHFVESRVVVDANPNLSFDIHQTRTTQTISIENSVSDKQVVELAIAQELGITTNFSGELSGTLSAEISGKISAKLIELGTKDAIGLGAKLAAGVSINNRNTTTERKVTENGTVEITRTTYTVKVPGIRLKISQKGVPFEEVNIDE